MRDVEQMLPPESASLSKSERDGANSTAAQSAEKLESLIRSVGEASSGEIDRVISQLEDVRAMLRREGERVTQEIEGYERLSELAMSTKKNINDRLKQAKSGT